MDWPTMKVEGSGAVRHLVLNRPQVHNAVNRQFLEDMVQACLHLETQPECRVVIVRGAGKSFCSGADQKEGLTHQGSVAERLYRSRSGTRAMQMLGDLTPVTIAAVHGNAIGGGAMVAMACDFCIGASTARLSIREVSLGLTLSWQTIPNVVMRVGSARAKEMILFGEFYGAQQMLEYGVYNQVVDEAQLLPAAEALAARVVAQPPLPVQMTKTSINAYAKALGKAVFHQDAAALALTGGSHDAQEAKEAFFAKRPGVWKGE